MSVIMSFILLTLYEKQPFVKKENNVIFFSNRKLSCLNFLGYLKILDIQNQYEFFHIFSYYADFKIFSHIPLSSSSVCVSIYISILVYLV